MPSSNLSLLGLVRHMADVEYNWFRRVPPGHDTGWRFRQAARPGERTAT